MAKAKNIETCFNDSKSTILLIFIIIKEKKMF